MVLTCTIFDIDGTLIDSNQFHVQAWYQAMKKAGASCPMTTIEKQIGKGADMLLPALFPDMSEAQRHEIASLHDHIFANSWTAAGSVDTYSS
jgi:beta-phosphoglucomutase-like phosphatase (HAD superfamily)